LPITTWLLFSAQLLSNQRVLEAVPSCKADWTECADNAELVNNYSRWFHAKLACKDAATKQARFGTPIFPSYPFFSTYFKTYIATGTAILMEKEAQFQNGFGAMVHSEVKCTYDLRAARVVSVDISAH
jgi:hypothetical protein